VLLIGSEQLAAGLLEPAAETLSVPAGEAVQLDLAVIGDAGVHERVAPDYWQGLSGTLVAHFREGRPRDGLVTAIREVGEELRRHFPRAPDDRDELSDEVSLS